MNLNRLVKYWIPPILWLIFFFPLFNRFLGSPVLYRALLSVFQIFNPDVSATAIEVPYIIIRKSIHFVEYVLLTFLLYRAFRGGNQKRWDIRWAVYTGVIAVGYGFLDEFLQTFVPTRNGSVIDSVINSGGVFVALGMIGRRKKKGSDETKACLTQKS